MTVSSNYTVYTGGVATLYSNYVLGGVVTVYSSYVLAV